VKFETYRLADISTGELPESDWPLLMNEDCPTRLAVIDGRFGTMHYIVERNDPGCFQDTVDASRAFGLSERFIAIITELHKQNITRVVFDADGCEIRGKAKNK
jgi:hypothetical protein